MDFQTFRLKTKDYPLFKFVDLLKWFPNDNEQTVKQNLKFWTRKKWLKRIIRGVYKLAETKIEDEFLIASYLNENSYVSLESALSFHGMITEIPYEITSVTIKKTKKYKTEYGIFSYRKIKIDLFFGFKLISGDNYLYRMATPEKALFDFIYLNQKEIRTPNYFREMRLTFPKNFSWKELSSLAVYLKNKIIISYLKSYVDNQ
ncbi:hypothetical protein A3A46_01595 [Candidatus Roizmanbacteria bacterium RIFCSPLOWO2_01_FULL_37_13]|uniref:AbiEi antitoxin C-terminal domain-containing protein n=1 Tax=Candidatus Roizmanbacteria bacterium RIFCSPHIGHO2_02_FULL_38_11 TaxID=1802039 RepID=A0A1F7GZX1_9BACT|nr:MAG: hypothetical protein A3C25_05955 [Candidatus Roizmanbacteria bacterium RIFCSPHIGHO2_02_FULL_38_11]OGK42560.1 MAG: hypothetical protein A3A46_01595 [Candidatus Roizmanbacteria bacterium RIFCSPLOWO2_01_FULL_37_13]